MDDQRKSIAGTVASAVRYLAKAILTGDELIQKFLNERELDLETVRRHLAGERGLGQRVFLAGVPRINDGTVQAQLANYRGLYDLTLGHGGRMLRSTQRLATA
jgi:hypothetical protein